MNNGRILTFGGKTSLAAMLIGSCALGAASLCGCNIVAPAYLLVKGPEKTDAMFVLPPDKTVVVFVDDRNSVLPSRAMRQQIAKAAEAVLLEGKILKADIISSDGILPISTGERFSKPKSIAEIGKAVGAQTVIYATVDVFTLSANGVEFTPVAQLRVKVVDVETEKRLWPGEDEQKPWFPVEYIVKTKSDNVPKNSSERAAAEQELATKVGRTLGNVFVKHETRERSDRIGE